MPVASLFITCFSLCVHAGKDKVRCGAQPPSVPVYARGPCTDLRSSTILWSPTDHCSAHVVGKSIVRRGGDGVVLEGESSTAAGDWCCCALSNRCFCLTGKVLLWWINGGNWDCRLR